MSLSVCKTRLVSVTREVSNQWDQTKHYWQDAKALEFEHEYMDLLQSSVEKAVTVIDELDSLIAKIRHDCE
jgi:predicted subunit of tRNA(5-methylaminomethyl-2-thiouridylate) methyltransferase